MTFQQAVEIYNQEVEQPAPIPNESASSIFRDEAEGKFWELSDAKGNGLMTISFSGWVFSVAMGVTTKVKEN